MSKAIVNSELDENRQLITTERTLQEIPLHYASLGPLLKAFMDQEPPKNTSDRGWAIKDIAQRNALRCFWDEFRQQHQQKFRSAGTSRTDMTNDMKLISADTDPDFLVALEAERKEFLAVTRSILSPSRVARRRPRQATCDMNGRQGLRPEGLVEPYKAPVESPATSNNLRVKKGRNFEANAEVQTEWGTTALNVT